ncbi:MAG: hypothetical protein Q6373_018735 [Candidatus Sigynarchaeota archaeon]
MEKNSIIFLTGAIWNIVASALFFLVSVVAPSAFTILGFTIPNMMVWFHTFLGFVGLIGVAFLIAYKDPPARRGIALLGACEKFFIPGILVGYFFAGGMGAIILGLCAVDVVYGVLFTWILLHEPSS